jgi:hypothetical protein
MTLSNRSAWIALAVLIGAGLVLRVMLLPHSRMIDEVQHRSALIARNLYFAMAGDVPSWRARINAVSVSRLPAKEPSIMPAAAAALYWAGGKERPWLGRALASVAWLAASVCLFLILRELVSPLGAVAGTAYFLFVPAGVSISTSFTSDALMIALLLAALLLTLRYHARPSGPRLAGCIACTSLAILSKPLIVFAVPAVFAALATVRKGSWKAILGTDVLLFVGASVSLGAIYYVHGVLFDSLRRQAELTFVPQLLGTTSFWGGWYLTAVDAAGFTPLVLAMLGAPLLERGAARATFIALAAAYVVFCLSFTYHIRIAEHYHLQLVVIVAFGVASACAAFLPAIAAARRAWSAAPVALVVAIVTLETGRTIERRFAGAPPREAPEIARAVGELVHHSDRVVYIASYYGRPLEFMGELSGTYWPRAQTDLSRATGQTTLAGVPERLAALPFEPEYYAITDLGEFRRHHRDLQAHLAANCALLADTRHYIVYGDCVHHA